MAIAFGDLSAGLISRKLKSRKKALFIFYGITSLFLFLYFALKGGGSAQNMYWLCAGLGFGTGFSVVYITMSAEQFGTNLRATAAVTIPNMVRGALPLINFLFLDILQKKLGWDIVQSGMFTGAIVMVITLIAYFFTEETYHKDLDYMEHDNPLP